MDPLAHHEWAEQIASGEGMGDQPYFRAPLHYYLLGTLYRVCGPNIAVGRLMGCLRGAVTCYLVGTNPPPRKQAQTVYEGSWHARLGQYYSTPAPDGPGDLAKSIDHYQKAVALAPGHGIHRIGLGRALTRMNRLTEAEEIFAIAVRRHPRHAEFRMQYAEALRRVEKHGKARVQYERAIALQPTYAEAYGGLGCLLVEMGRNREGIEHLRTALSIRPGLARAQECLKRARSGAGQRPVDAEGPGPGE